MIRIPEYLERRQQLEVAPAPGLSTLEPAAR